MAHDLRADVGEGSSSTRIAHSRSVKRSQTLPTVPLSLSKTTVAHLSTPSALKGKSWGSPKSVRADSDEERVPVTPSSGRTTSSAGEPASIRANLFSSVPAKVTTSGVAVKMEEDSDPDSSVFWPPPSTKSAGKKPYRPMPRRRISPSEPSTSTISTSSSSSSLASLAQVAPAAPNNPIEAFKYAAPSTPMRSPTRPKITTAQAASPDALHARLFGMRESASVNDSDSDTGPSWPSPTRKAAPISTPPTTSHSSSSSSTSSLLKTLANTSVSTPATDVDMADLTTTKPDTAPPPPSCVSKGIWDMLDDSVQACTIAYDEEVQALARKHRFSFGVQFELARGVVSDRWTWDEVKTKLKEEREVEIDRNGKTAAWSVDPQRHYYAKSRKTGAALLEGDNVDVAWRVGELMTGKQKKKPDLELWRELDREEKAMQEGKGRGLGLMGDWESCPNWYGGRIQVVFRLHKIAEGFKVLVEPLESRRSHYFSRMLGSRRLAQIKIPDDYLLKDIQAVRTFLRQRFVFMGASYLPYHAKDGNSVYCIDSTPGGGTLSTFSSVCEWHNPIERNFRQPIAKYSTRNTIGFSNSVPVLEFADEDIHFDFPDLVATEGLEPGVEPLSHQLMTDGCGFMNRTALLVLKVIMGLESPPSCVQGRIAGAKGVWALHPTDTSLRPIIWIRPSQNKIKLPRPLDRAHRIFNLLRTSRRSDSCSLSIQIILNLSHNHVPHETLVRKLEEGLRMELQPLMEWTRPRAMEQLWHAVARLGHIALGRAARIARVESRALGLSGRDRVEVEAEAEEGVRDIDDVEETARPAYTGRNSWSGLPITAHETIVEAIQAGFKPNESHFLHEKLHTVFKYTIDNATKDYRLPVMQSTTAIMIPDPIGILEEGQVYFKPSNPFRHPVTGELLHQLEGDVLVASDVQKVEAVDVHEFQSYVDILILPTKGSRSLASVLSGGDYDGDEDVIIWDPEIVAPFRNHPIVDEPKDFLADHFEKQVEKVPEFCQRLNNVSKAEAQRSIFDILLLNVCDSKVGLYSKFHDCAVWQYGLNHPSAILMAYMFNTVLDAPKTGLQVKKLSFDSHRNQFNHSTPWDPPSYDSSPPSREARGEFVLDNLRDAGQGLKDKYLEEFEHIPTECDERTRDIRDVSLLEPYLSARRIAAMLPESFPAFRDELDSLAEHVRRHIKLYATDTFKDIKKSPYEDTRKKKKGKNKSASGDEASLARLVKSFYSTMPQLAFTPHPESVAASYAYQEHPRFAFTVAFKTLGTLKALSTEGGIAPCTRSFDEGRVMSSAFLRAIQNGDDDD
ncbi:hypothetical protein CCMSSC00406_0009575 [Pleurotus cornucopiae]|uniref:Uncharacterized protein n=1 Tax=Pleurotus cornucopiae TaxID=5321 RepID=A0ACB7IWN8_PLECO|nr:hypothetical protein CCMSSC00406_0009575 [Pleurotus cornucopiae]